MIEPQPLYVSRRLKNTRDLVRWAESQGVTIDDPDKLHVTVVYSRQPVDWFAAGDAWSGELRITPGGARAIERLGSAVVLRFASSELQWRWQQWRDLGASWDFPDYKPHVTLTYDDALDLDLIEPYRGELVFGPEIFEEPRDPGREDPDRVRIVGRVSKVDVDQRLVYGWFSVIENSEGPIVDAHGDRIDEQTLVEAAHAFMTDSRAGKMMHSGKRVADVVESIVFTRDVQKALGIDLGKVGWFACMKVRDDEVWQRVKSGDLRAFSIGGVAQRIEAD